MTTAVITIEQPDPAAIEAENFDLVARAEQMEVTDAASHGAAILYLVDLKRADKSVCDRIDPIIANAYRTHKSLTALKSQVLRPIELARATITGKKSTYEQRERARAEAERVERERELRKIEEEARLAAACAAEAAGRTVQAECIINAPVIIKPVAAAPQLAKVSGVSQRTTYKANVTDKWALIQHVAQHPELAYLLDAAMKHIDAIARDQKDKFSLPGAELVVETSDSIQLA